MRGKYPICRSCYRKYLVDGKQPEWLRYLINSLVREQRADAQHAENDIPLDLVPRG